MGDLQLRFFFFLSKHLLQCRPHTCGNHLALAFPSAVTVHLAQKLIFPSQVWKMEHAFFLLLMGGRREAGGKTGSERSQGQMAGGNCLIQFIIEWGKKKKKDKVRRAECGGQQGCLGRRKAREQVFHRCISIAILAEAKKHNGTKNTQRNLLWWHRFLWQSSSARFLKFY